jgi:Amt family ammonium transporter
MLTASFLVLMMTIPGLALFYGGMVRAKNVLSVLMQCFAITALLSVLWVVYGYSLAFDDTGMREGAFNLHALVGGLHHAMLAGLAPGSLHGSVPESVFVMFQMTFAIVTPALIIGAIVERMKFSALLWFVALWFTVVYAPMAHMVWGGKGALLGDWGVIDFAGGMVVHINAGIAGLVACLVIGRRHGYPHAPMPPHNLGYTLIGASMLWLGWFGFNAGSAVSAGGTASMAMLVTQIATAAAGLSWMFAEWIVRRKPSVLGIISGAVAGLVAITPAAGFVNPTGALVIGLVAGVVCYWGATGLKHMFGYDDALDAFGVHGVGGIVGAILTGVFASQAIGGTAGLIESNPGQVITQLYGIAATIVWTAVMTFVILKVIGLVIGLRVSPETETEGLDIVQHGEVVQ